MSDVHLIRDHRQRRRRHEVAVEARRTLADVLRHDLGYTGTHLGCEHGVCGACTVLVDGAPTRSCLLFGVQADDAEVETVEGLGAPTASSTRCRRPSRAHHALQCGFCTPGFLMLATALLRENPEPDRRRRSATRWRRTSAAARATSRSSRRCAPPPTRGGGRAMTRGRPLGPARRGRAAAARRAARFVDDVDRPASSGCASCARRRRTRGSRASTPRRRARLPGVHAVLTAADLDPVPRIPVRLGPFDEPLDALPPAAARRRRASATSASRSPSSCADDPYLAEDAAELVDAELRAARRRRSTPRRAVEPTRRRSTAARQRRRARCRAATATPTPRSPRAAARRRARGRTSGATPAVPLETRGLVADVRRGAGRLTSGARRRSRTSTARVLAGLLGMRPERASAAPSRRRRRLRRARRVLPRGLPRAVRRARARPAGEVDRGPRRAPRRHQPLAPSSAAGSSWRVRRRRRAARRCATRSGTTTAPTCARTASSSPELTAEHAARARTACAAYEGRAHVAVDEQDAVRARTAGPGATRRRSPASALLDAAARRARRSTALELRRRNLLRADDLPHDRDLPVLGHPVEIDAGDFAGLLDAALARSGYEDWRARRPRRGSGAAAVGTGVALLPREERRRRASSARASRSTTAAA